MAQSSACGLSKRLYSRLWLTGLAVGLVLDGDALAQSKWEREAYDSAARMPAAESVVLDQFERHDFSAPGAHMPYRLLPPTTSEPGRRYPLVVWLHGSGAIGEDNEKQLGASVRAWAAPALRTRYPAYVVAPQMYERSANYRPDADGLPAAEAGPPLPVLLALIDDLASRLPIDRERIYLTGFSMGASTALLATVQRPQQFAAVVAFAPVPPPRSAAAVAAATPMLLVHGDTDTENPYIADRAWADALAKAGSCLRFLTIEGMAHEFPAQLVGREDWRDWLFAQRRSDVTGEPRARCTR